MGERKNVQIEFASLYDYTPLAIPVEVVRGNQPGPTMFISGAIHGDEINGTEIIKRVLKKSALKQIRGSLIAIPVVNVFGFNTKSRYLPDRRDLNRCFPGSRNGSLAARLASIFMREIVNKSNYGIDLHTAAIHRSNLPQIRACLDDPQTKDLAKAFGVPVMIHSEVRDGSLREASRRKGIPMLLFEGGEALRFNEDVIKTGVSGCLSVMRKVGMLPPRSSRKGRVQKREAFMAKDSYWIRAPHSGSFRSVRKLGDAVKQGETIAVISDLFGKNPVEVAAKDGGVVIGMSTMPLVNRGDAMFHIATFHNLNKVKSALDAVDA